jgi:beta-lactamase superfamily II metal-dependent hydrolase
MKSERPFFFIIAWCDTLGSPEAEAVYGSIIMKCERASAIVFYIHRGTTGVVVLLVLLLSIAIPSGSLEAGPGDLYARVVDVGAGQCCVVAVPGEGDDKYYVVYDAGNYRDRGATALAAIQDIIPADERIDLLVLSHTDSDHNGAVPAIVKAYPIDRVLRTGMERKGDPPKTLSKARTAIHKAVEKYGTLDVDLKDTEFMAGSTYRFGEAFVTMVCGFGEIPEDWAVSGNSERNNAVSIVIRVVYKEKSILLCGDAVGRHGGSDSTESIATEKYMLEQEAVIPLDADVLVAPHHGADNGSSQDFIQAVTPDYVIFSAGHHYEHPRSVVVERYLAEGVDEDQMFRTDWGDNEGGKEWEHGATDVKDKQGDDDIDIVIRKNGTIEVAYRDH